MKNTLKILAITAFFGITVVFSSCEEESPSVIRVSGIVSDDSTDEPLKGVYLALIGKEDCDWLNEECKGYNVLIDGYSDVSGNYSLGYYGTSPVYLIVKRSEIAVFVDSINDYKLATVMAFQCPSINDHWHSAIEMHALDYYSGIGLNGSCELDINIKLEYLDD